MQVDHAQTRAGAELQTFVANGEPDAGEALRICIGDELVWKVAGAQHGEAIEARASYRRERPENSGLVRAM